MKVAVLDTIHFPVTGGMNSDDDIRTISQGDVIEVVNGRWFYNSQQKLNTIENIIGTRKIDFGLPVGFNKSIGAKEDKVFNRLIYFVYNSNSDHSILIFDPFTEKIFPIMYSEPVLNFNKNNLIIDIDVVDNGDEGLVYFTDNYNPPRKVNVERARKYTLNKYNEGIGYWVIEDTFIIS